MSTVNCAMLGGHPGQLLDEAPGEKKTYVPVSDGLGLYGRHAGASRVYRMEDGRVYAEFKEEFGKAKVLYANENEAAQAFIGLRKQQAAEAHIRTGAEATAAGTPPTFERTLTTKELDPELHLDQVIHGDLAAAPADPETFITGNLRLKVAELLPVRDWLKVSGQGGQSLVSMFERKAQIEERLMARHNIQVERILSGLTDDEIAGMRRIIEDGVPARQEVYVAHRQLNALADRLYDEAKALGIDVADRVDNYFPHVHNQRRFTDPQYLDSIRASLAEQGYAPDQIEGIISHSALGKDKTEAIADIINRHKAEGKELSLAEANSIFERFVQQNSHFISGHLERERTSSIPPIDDGRLAYTVAFSKNIHRLAEAQVFGSSYEKAFAVIDQIKREAGERPFQLARRAFDLEIGRTQVRLPDWAEALHDWQSAKLSLSVLSNLTQAPVNVPARVGGLATLQAFARFLAAPREGVQHAREVGSIVFHALDQLQAHGIQALFPPNEAQSLFGRAVQTAGKAVKELSLVAFNYAEAMNRGVATYAGEYYFDQQVARLARNPADQLALRRLNELGFTSRQSIDHIIQNAATPNEGLLPDFRRLTGKIISDETQFVSRVSTRPLFFQESAAGKMLYQFKQFSVGQTEFMVNNLFAYKRGDTERSLRTLGLILTAFPAIGGAAVGLRSLFTGETPSTKAIEQFFSRPTVGHAVLAGIAAIATTGTLGILADLSGTALLGNSFSLGTFAVAPSLSTAINTVSASASVLKGITTQDLGEFETAARVAGREFGGLGSAVVKATLGEPDRKRKGSALSGLSGLRGLQGL